MPRRHWCSCWLIIDPRPFPILLRNYPVLTNTVWSLFPASLCRLLAKMPKWGFASAPTRQKTLKELWEGGFWSGHNVWMQRGISCWDTRSPGSQNCASAASSYHWCPRAWYSGVIEQSTCLSRETINLLGLSYYYYSEYLILRFLISQHFRVNSNNSFRWSGLAHGFSKSRIKQNASVESYHYFEQYKTQAPVLARFAKYSRNH